MAEEIAFENGQISNFEGLVTLTLDRVVLHTVVHHSYRPLPTWQISLKSKKVFVDGRTHVHTYARTFETGFIRSTLLKSRPKNRIMSTISLAYVRKDISVRHLISVTAEGFTKGFGGTSKDAWAPAQEIQGGI